MEPSPCTPPHRQKSFAKTPRTWSKTSQFSGSHTYKTKQTTFASQKDGFIRFELNSFRFHKLYMIASTVSNWNLFSPFSSKEAWKGVFFKYGLHMVSLILFFPLNMASLNPFSPQKILPKGLLRVRVFVCYLG